MQIVDLSRSIAAPSAPGSWLCEAMRSLPSIRCWNMIATHSTPPPIGPRLTSASVSKPSAATPMP